MLDPYVDIAELVRYGQHFIAAAPTFISVDPAVDVTCLINGQKTFVELFQKALAQADASRGDLRGAQGARREFSDEVASVLRQFFNAALPLADAGTIDIKRFFDRGQKTSIGKSYADRSRALQLCIDAFAAYPEVKELEAWATRLKELQSRFTEAMNSTSSQDSAKRLDTKSLRQQRAAWRRHYQACKYMMRGLLTMVDREDEYKGLFLDLQTGGSASTVSSEPAATSSDETP